MKWYLNHLVHGRKPWAVQTEAMRRSGGRPRYGQFLEPGLGKTALDLNEYITAVHAGEVDFNIVLAPNSFKADWPLAVPEWGLDCPTGMWPCDPVPYGAEWGLYALNYEAARSSAHDQIARLMDERRCLLTIDESSAIKNPSSLTTKAVLDLAKRAAMVRELNGTPITHTVMDYWPQLRALGELNGINPYAFRNRFAVIGGFMGKQIKGMKNEEELGRILDACSFRALKKDWRKDLPPQVQVTHHLEMTDKQVRHYRTMMEEFYALVEGDEVTASLVLTQYDKLRQISSCLLMDRGTVHWLEEPKDNPKIKACLDLISNGDSKFIVSHFYRPSGQALMLEFIRAGLNPVHISGGMKPEEIIETKRRFNEDSDCRVLVGQQGATFRGHTLIGRKGDRCDSIIYYENSFSYYQRSQMNDRNHRGEQDQTCWLIDLITSPMDQLVVDILSSRRDMASGMDDIIKAVRNSRRAF